MTEALSSRLGHGRPALPSVAAGADGAVGDGSAHVAVQLGAVAAQTDGLDLDVVTQTVAALYVDPKGVYANLPNVEVWDEARDARLYAGPHPVVAHPPCASWSAWAGMREAVYGRPRGEDGGCFAAALDAVRQFGGVLEHPAYSKAWDAFGLPIPSVEGAWSQTLYGEWTCSFDQAAYGLRFNKHTWLYYVGNVPPDFIAHERPRTGRGPDDVWSDARSRTSLAMGEYLLRLARLSWS